MSDTELLPASALPSEQEPPVVPLPVETGAETPATKNPDPSDDVALVDIAVPVYNEAEVLGSSIQRLRQYLDRAFPFTASIVIVDNASTDQTWEVAVRVVR